MADKIYAPINAKERDGRFGQEFSISFNAEKLRAFIASHTNAKGYVNLKMHKRREAGKFGETHSLTLDTWEPAQTPLTTMARRATGPSVIDDIDIPFVWLVPFIGVTLASLLS